MNSDFTKFLLLQKKNFFKQKFREIAHHNSYLLLRLEAVEEEEEEVLDDPGGGQKAFLEADFRRSLI